MGRREILFFAVHQSSVDRAETTKPHPAPWVFGYPATPPACRESASTHTLRRRRDLRLGAPDVDAVENLFF